MRLAFRGDLEITHREFQSVELAKWLQSENVAFALRQKGKTYIQQKDQDFHPLNSLELSPGLKRFLTGVKITKSKGFGGVAFAKPVRDSRIAAYSKGKYKGKKPDEPWYIFTNLGSCDEAITAYKAPSGIEAMFFDWV